MVSEFHELEFFEKIVFKFPKIFLMELEYHKKLKFLRLEYQKSDRFLYISEIVVD